MLPSALGFPVVFTKKSATTLNWLATVLSKTKCDLKIVVIAVFMFPNFGGTNEHINVRSPD
jgi:hypothetical protein